MKLFVSLFLASQIISFEKTTYPQFANKSHQELQQYFGLHPDYLQDTMLSMFMQPKVEGIQLPEGFDWREKSPECIHPVRDQGHCGSCWAHSSSEVVSDRFCIHSQGKINTTFSPQ